MQFPLQDGGLDVYHPAMTIAELMANEALRQEEFPVTKQRVFLGHAAVCPLPKRVAEAIAKFALNCVNDDQEKVPSPLFLAETRALAGILLGAVPD